MQYLSQELQGLAPHLPLCAADSLRQESFFCPPQLAAYWKRHHRLRGTRKDRVGGNTWTVVGRETQTEYGDRVWNKGQKAGSYYWAAAGGLLRMPILGLGYSTQPSVLCSF